MCVAKHLIFRDVSYMIYKGLFLPTKEFSACGTSSDAERQQLLLNRDSTESYFTERWLQGAGTEPECCPWPLCNNGKW